MYLGTVRCGVRGASGVDARLAVPVRDAPPPPSDRSVPAETDEEDDTASVGRGLGRRRAVRL
jgi:hypothetical protein